MFNRLFVSAALIVFASAPAFANGAHAEKGASRQGTSGAANFDSPTTINGISVTPFFNVNDGVNPLIDIFQIPSSFTSGTSFTLSFTNINLGYGIFDCDNGSAPTAVSADFPTPVGLVGPCTQGALGSNDPFVTYTEVGNKSTITFNAGTGNTPPPAFYFWTPDQNLLGIAASSSTPTVPEPGTFAMLAAGLIGIALMRRRAVQA
jgi:hypothetical protein